MPEGGAGTLAGTAGKFPLASLCIQRKERTVLQVYSWGDNQASCNHNFVYVFISHYPNVTS